MKKIIFFFSLLAAAACTENTTHVTTKPVPCHKDTVILRPWNSTDGFDVGIDNGQELLIADTVWVEIPCK